MSRSEVSHKLICSTHTLNVDFESSYYANRNLLQSGLSLIEEAIEIAKDVDDIRTSEVRDLERIHYYAEEKIENENEDLNDLENVIMLIANGLAWKIENPEEFTGYNSEITRYADEIGINIKTKAP